MQESEGTRGDAGGDVWVRVQRPQGGAQEAHDRLLACTVRGEQEEKQGDARGLVTGSLGRDEKKG